LFNDSQLVVGTTQIGFGIEQTVYTDEIFSKVIGGMMPGLTYRMSLVPVDLQRNYGALRGSPHPPYLFIRTQFIHKKY
jgi:hypothetical protein